MEQAVWDDKLLNGLEFMSKSVLQVPFLLMTLMRYVTPTLDEMYVLLATNSLTVSADHFTSFMQSIQWVDTTYVQKHKSEDPHHLRSLYYPNLVQYSAKGGSSVSRPIPQALKSFFNRYAKKIGMMLGIYLLSMVVVIGRFVMPAASFYTFRSHVGSTPAAVIFGVGLILPKTYIVTFLHTYFASRSLMRELVSPITLPYLVFPLLTTASLNPTFGALSSLLSKSVGGSATVKVFSSALPSRSRFFCAFHTLAC